MLIKQSNLFKQVYKKIHKNQLYVVNENIKLILNNTKIGTLKTGDLSSIRIHKFKLLNHLYLIAYEYEEKANSLYLMAIGEHENFYDKLKKHLKS